MHPATIAAAIGGLGAIGLALLWPRSARAEEQLEPWRRRLLECARGHVQAKTLYQWGGGHGWLGDAEYGLDCSGLVLQCAKQAGVDVWMTSNGMYEQLPPVETPRPGDLALYGKPDRAWHVRIVEAWHPEEGRAETIGAEGGGPKVTSPERAVVKNAHVRRVPDHRASHFLGFRTLAGRENKIEPVAWYGAG